MTAGPGEMALVLEPGTRDDGCAAAFSRWSPSDTAVLLVTFVDTPDSQLDAWLERAGESPRELAVVRAGTGAASVDADRWDGDYVSTVPHPSNLTRLGVEITRALDHLQAETEGVQLVACFRSVSALLQYASRDHVFQFLTVLRDRFAEADVAAHAHLDVDAHDDQTIATLRWLFDDVVE